MITLHQEMRAKPEKSDEVMAALAAIIPDWLVEQQVMKFTVDEGRSLYRSTRHWESNT